MSKMPSIILIWLLVLGLAACQHDPGPNSQQCGEATTIDEMMEWIYFKTGTYWIYEEESTGELDTLTVVAHAEGIHQGTNSRWFSYEAVSSRDGYTYYWWFSESYTVQCPANQNCLCHKVWCNKYKTGSAKGQITMFPFPIFTGNWIGNQEGGVSRMEQYPIYLELEDTLTVASAKFLIENAITDEGTNVYYYISPHLGITRKELFELELCWILRKFEIIQ